MAELAGDTTCTIHPERSSSAQCSSCRRFFCPECITEHEGKLICAECLSALSKPAVEKTRTRIPWAAMIQFMVALILAWMLFFFFAQTLGDIPDDFHDGTIWE